MTTVTKRPASHAVAEKMVYRFGDGRAEGNGQMKELLGGKGAGLAEMSSLGLPVPPGFTITTGVCTAYYERGREYPPGLEEEVRAGIQHIEQITGVRFGDPEAPLLVSVRSGARVSMPGMMDTVLNLGLNDAIVEGLARRTDDPRFAYDSYRRFIQMYGDVVMGIRPDEHERDPFEVLLDAKKRKKKAKNDRDLEAKALKELVREYKDLVRKETGADFPEEPWDQLWGALGAVFASWENDRAIAYRRMHGYPDDWGTAVNVQAMVFGNLGDTSGTGVFFTRNASNGEKGLFGEFVVNAQGEDVVAGVRTPGPILRKFETHGGPPSLETAMPESFAELRAHGERLERHYRDMQDIEFTIQQGKLWVLQTRNGKRTGLAMVKIAVDMVDEALISAEEAVRRVDPDQLNELLHPVFDEKADRQVIARGLGASPGAAVGTVIFTPREATALAEKGAGVILVREETSPEDIEGMKAARGILTARGGMTSHAAVVARAMGKCCISGCAEIEIDYGKRRFTATGGGRRVAVKEGDVISLDGTTGEVMLGALPTVEARFPQEYHRLMGWVDQFRRLRVRANADTPSEAERARSFGAEGIGLCRTEHMFWGEDRILAVREMILAQTEVERRRALDKILPMQREDFTGILRAMAGFPVTIRLLDPPLHEFVPHTAAEIRDLAKALKMEEKEVQRRVESLRESNPMLGHRGVRLAITYPEIYEVQVRAIIDAACALDAEDVEVHPEIMIPLVGIEAELSTTRELVERTAEAVMAECGRRVNYTIGTMIELPRACVVADEIARHADFFSFGTNDLTQTAFGFSRDDIGHFLPAYEKRRIIEHDPFVRLDTEGVGGLIRLGVERGRQVKPALKVGICGEHGGDPASVAFCHEQAFDYVSCSQYRVPIALLAAAQAALGRAEADNGAQ
jgi:pyruvate,orthophosphate dikinase